ncbi:hypothetical protein [Desulfitobacterium sp.]|uniref:hypothetical protein n=1 Tax=Desulfitobacterium sp. TaxID=49981 RepID=UPI002CF84556|nr:hypothetical protein [Desulfitobacterium sp.]HVJ48249.1 hypothetical protein [Desulfitobacterium sp.]
MKLVNGYPMVILVNSDRHSYVIRPLIAKTSGHRSYGIRPSVLSNSAKGRYLMHGVYHRLFSCAIASFILGTVWS